MFKNVSTRPICDLCSMGLCPLPLYEVMTHNEWQTWGSSWEHSTIIKVFDSLCDTAARAEEWMTTLITSHKYYHLIMTYVILVSFPRKQEDAWSMSD